MKFGPVPVGEAEGAICAHSIKLPGRTVKKGLVLTAEHIALLQAEHIENIICARLETDDVHEDEAALSVARLAAGEGVRVDNPFTGRCNLFAEHAGLLCIDEPSVDRLNRIDEGLTFATLPAFAPVEAGRMIATAKIIPFALPRPVIESTLADFPAGSLISVQPFQPLKVGLIQTRLPSLKTSVLDKTRRITEERLAMAEAPIVDEFRVSHESGEVADAIRSVAEQGAELILIFGSSAIIDKDDVVPTGIRAAGGVVEHFGMPVDPGNLLLIGRLGHVPILGAPGCARSPKENGFDWVLNRLLAKIQVSVEDITGMGVGGLLMEITSRPQLRQPAISGDTVAAIVLAAGQSRRMGGGRNKLLAQFDGEPLVRRSVRTALQSKASPVLVVTGHMEHQIRRVLEGLDVTIVHNPDFAEGLSTSLKCGIRALPDKCAGVLVMLADMPGIDAQAIDRLVDAFDPGRGKSIILPTASGKRGNPVLWSRDHFPSLRALTGDVGARHLLAENEDAVHQVDIGQDAIADVDTPEALVAAGGKFGDQNEAKN